MNDEERARIHDNALREARAFIADAAVDFYKDNRPDAARAVAELLKRFHERYPRTAGGYRPEADADGEKGHETTGTGEGGNLS